MKKIIGLLFLLSVGIHLATAQKKFFCKTAKISFFSKSPLEDIESHNTKALTAFDPTTGQIEFSVLMKGFEFEKAKMQEHFNEEYIESDRYPKGVFVGAMKNPGDLKLDKDGVYKVQVTGSLTLHGITKPQNADAVFSIKNGEISAASEFTVAVADYNIKIPALVAEHIGKTVKVVINVPSYQSN